jgi:mRNA interferase MazF
MLLARLPQLAPPGHEQSGMRPVLVVALPHRVGRPRYPIIVAAPLTTQLGEWAKVAPNLYPVLEAGVGGLVSRSAVMLEHLRGIDAGRIVRPLGTLSGDQYAPIKASLEKMFGFREGEDNT